MKPSRGAKCVISAIILLQLTSWLTSLDKRTDDKIKTIDNLFEIVSIDGYNFNSNESGVGYFKAESSDDIAYSVSIRYDNNVHGDTYRMDESSRNIISGTNASFEGFVPDLNVLELYGEHTTDSHTLLGYKYETYNIRNNTPCVFVYYNEASNKVRRLYIDSDPDTVHSLLIENAKKATIFFRILLIVFILVDTYILLTNVYNKFKIANEDRS